MVTNLMPFPSRLGTLTNITPFTYSDGTTFQEKLELLRAYINDSMRPEFEEKMSALLAEFQTAIQNSENTVTETLAGWDTRFTDFMADIVAELQGLNDSAMANLITTEASATRIALIQFLASQHNGPHALMIDVTKAPYNVVFDAPIWTDAIVTQNTLGMRAACATPGFIGLPAGYFVTEGDIPINTHSFVKGRGMGATVHKVKDGMGWDPRSFYFPAGTKEAGLADLTTDGNALNRNADDGSGGIMGTNVSVINSTDILVENVKAINSVQHGFDATTPYYGQAGDGAIIPDPSERVTFRNCVADKYGDDGFSSHGSGKIIFDGCYALGTRYAEDVAYTNSNGFEIDDYSYDVTLSNCYSTGNAHGFEFKAHGDQSAATNIRVVNCYAERNEVNFSARHIGNHTAGHPYSKTAKDLQFSNCTSKHPRRVFFGGTVGADGDVPDGETPPGFQYNHMVIGAYRGVTVTNFHCISDPSYNYANSAGILVHFKAEDIVFDGGHIEGHVTGSFDIQCTGGAQPAAHVTIMNWMFKDSAPSSISTGAASQGVIMNNKFSRNVAGSPNGTAITAYGNKIVRGNQFFTQFAPNFNISGTLYSAWESPLVANTTWVAPPVTP